MSHYFKRESDYQRQGNGEGSSSSIVPIFNTKRKRIKQALYSNPSSSQENKSSFSNSASQFSSGFKSKFNATQERQTENSLNSTSLPKNNHESTYTRPMQIKPEVKKQDKSAPKNLPCMPKPRPQFGVGGIPLKSSNGNQENIKRKTSVNMSFKPGQPEQKNGTFQLQRKLENNMEKSAKMYTATIKKVMDWEEFRDKTSGVIFEVYGVLESAVSTNSLGNSKSFMIKDNTSSMRCTFWEMDRSLPRLTRGRNYRVVGSLDRRTKSFHCVSVRPANPVEVRLAETSIACSEMAMQLFIARFKED